MPVAFEDGLRFRSQLWNLPINSYDDRWSLFSDIVQKWNEEQGSVYSEKNKIRFLEIGVWQAGLLFHIHRLMGDLFDYTGVDPYGELVNDPYKGLFWKTSDEADAVYKSALEIFTQRKAHLVREASSAFFEKNQEQYDIILVDGDHTFKGALDDMESAFPVLRSGGLMIVDDVGNNFHPEVEWAVRRFSDDQVDKISAMGTHPLFFQLPGMKFPVMLQLACFKKK